MKNEFESESKKQIESLMDYFPEPRTIPHGWDLSEMFTAAESDRFTNIEAKNTEELGKNSCLH